MRVKRQFGRKRQVLSRRINYLINNPHPEVRAERASKGPSGSGFAQEITTFSSILRGPFEARLRRAPQDEGLREKLSAHCYPCSRRKNNRRRWPGRGSKD